MADLVGQIHDGILPPGTAVPSTANLAAHYGVSHNTSRDAIKRLMMEGVLVGQWGRGVFVAEGPAAAHDPSPHYRRIIADLTRLIDGGTYPPGARLPSTAELAKQYQVSHNTVRQAIGRLLGAGLLVGHQELGVYVAEPPSGSPHHR